MAARCSTERAQPRPWSPARGMEGEQDPTDLLTAHGYVFVQDELGYRHTITADVATARAVEDAARGGALDNRKPLLNPLPAPSRPGKATRWAASIRAGRYPSAAPSEPDR